MIDIEKIKSRIEELSTTLKSFNLDSLYIEQNGKIDVLKQGNGRLHQLRSCSKMFVAMAIGIAMDKGMKVNDKKVDLNMHIYPVIKNVVNINNSQNKNKIEKWTLRDLLLHQTGYASQMFNESCINNLDKNTLLDYALNYDIPYEVGTRYAYNNVEPFIISVFFQEAFGINLGDFINQNVLKKMDILEYKWENYGKYCPGGTGLYLKESDFHKVGQLLLNNGIYGEKQIISKYWINEMCTLQNETPSAYKPERVFKKVGTGYYIFISENGYIFRDGADGQYIIINKDKNLLISIMSSEKEMKYITEIFRDLI